MTDPKQYLPPNTYDPTKDPLYQELVHFLQQMENKAAQDPKPPASIKENATNQSLLP